MTDRQFGKMEMYNLQKALRRLVQEAGTDDETPAETLQRLFKDSSDRQDADPPTIKESVDRFLSQCPTCGNEDCDADIAFYEGHIIHAHNHPEQQAERALIRRARGPPTRTRHPPR